MTSKLASLTAVVAFAGVMWTGTALACEAHKAKKASTETTNSQAAEPRKKSTAKPAPAATPAEQPKAAPAPQQSALDAVDEAMLAAKCSCESQADCTCKKGKCQCSRCGHRIQRTRMIDSLKGQASPLKAPPNVRNASAGVFI
jgi:hypothetical protein